MLQKNRNWKKEHFPVMLKEVLNLCSPEKGGNFLDCTFGSGGYTKEILKYPNTKVIAIDRDKFTEEKARKLREKYPDRFLYQNEKFSKICKFKNENIDNIIFDLGLSINQIFDETRGFSFNSKNSIDMGMGFNEVSMTDLINKGSKEKLKSILRLYGEENDASKIVASILNYRKNKEITNSKKLSEIINESKGQRKRKINLSTKSFQAFRMFINQEIKELLEGIICAAKIIKPGGKIIVISFHSIEDRIIKFFFKNYSKQNKVISRYFPDKKISDEIFENFSKKVLLPSNNEIKKNPASRSAKLRFAVRGSNKFKNLDELKNKFKKYTEILH